MDVTTLTGLLSDEKVAELNWIKQFEFSFSSE